MKRFSPVRAFGTAGVLLMAAVSNASAAVDTLNVVSASWSNPQPTSGTNVNYQTQGGGNNQVYQVRWGIPIGNAQSGLGFDPFAPPTSNLPALGQPFQLGTLYHYNNPIAGGTALTSVDLGVNTTLTINGSNINTGPFNFRFSIDETPNTPPCAYPSDPGNPCADAITFTNLASSSTFMIGGQTYTMKIVGFGNSSNSISSSFISQEGGTNSTNLYAAILAPSAVPEPSSIILFGTVLTGLGLKLRRRLS